jgi:hypothetical protein
MLSIDRVGLAAAATLSPVRRFTSTTVIWCALNQRVSPAP